ncbi:flavin-containing monooxygenase [Amphiplicatus metriothermophilus]|uniref:Predicted flavoprotein CzcO associated with the cation diffusion facilitator CzcD n=1 Tax=Amphiplicatus metriothermophilus TaxID=1519374 RepID=A0A239PXD0_9PROT|nr:NAD(P)/FAD-dependent oxidoreductase [Amphiplicatus metriothermophilus]MBB5520016.1 cation diffusion facilitator CzcD-associated flavoprotein CzcO [Amphiplicatus metriothermophilus]SNT74915.1 Predicted flavoprotein CzcO associated with the cation diffusion facilitator CzcD [Amphiplicatus metriothermophilus]
MPFDQTRPDSGFRIAILGAGFSGMGMAVALKRRGFDDFVIYEKADDVGGTWRENTYPGVACDVPSHLYSFSFDINPEWTRRYSSGQEIWDYMRRCARKHGLYEKTEFGRKAVRLRHDGRRWTIEFADGGTAQADIVVSGLGGLHEPNIPDFPGMESFAGPVFHTARWRHDVDLAGKRVAIIGSAASAVQAIPEIAPKVARLDVYQRTPNWVMPRQSYAYPAWARKLFKMIPPLARLYRAYYFFLLESRHLAFHRNDNFMKRFVRRQFARHLEEQVRDPELRAKLTPDYPVGCKRILISDDYFPAIQRDNVALVTEGVDRFEESGIRTKDGRLREVDVVILATGFKPFNLVESVEAVGPSGASLREVWADGIKAHRTVAAPGFPNFFMLLGPNSGLGHNSVVLMIEAQVKYVLQLIEKMKASGAALVEPTPEAAAAYDARIQRELSQRVWAAGCGAWYVDERGRNYTLYPHTVRRFLKEMKAPDMKEYVLRETVAAAV